MAEIIPAIMPANLEDLREKLARVDGLVPLVQIDIMDGIFVPSRSWPFIEGGLDEFARIVAEEDGLPFWNTLDFEIDLMVSSPETAIRQWFAAGARRFIVHIESILDFEEILDFFDVNIRAEDEGAELGVALNVDTPNAVIEPFLDRVHFVQCMGIERIGFQNEPFDERVLERIVDLRERYPDVILSVDGGVGLETASVLIEAGVDRLAVGSDLFESDDIEKTLREFQSLT
ncbi:hypothetical protein A3D66_00730 [Candidatus Kaiserbacteria bacterium RIFCSPHIGHO2_02_FULL_50_9]|uniref:Ribulose-phosphate 3-epimerase n=1 Tax=Candidatus Kaiserbacteria bacterium RIFCSPLOWO2_01_FULL_51_21 TaxID=1798508 RepID=A0A1F6EDA7_9BACT|nr:MAG: hypothetical protein A2761_00840 [Candidatus Kaiserbacteria bacterium RIFCSPHIGHO2_01_FULL_51_33]OGG63539.1 MAG: hypothetical protein A3D66_00730 [Candidatus Kaiserbacteria bacterium RIFCSPHIGHO2_02_FULL_50_9]OGG71587.1 MAG: hypothetical protein A3A35_02925 [Candidatus Kaiserbacteria bacterium RIFCSPLOWO2_01_FULL_51_21]